MVKYYIAERLKNICNAMTSSPYKWRNKICPPIFLQGTNSEIQLSTFNFFFSLCLPRSLGYWWLFFCFQYGCLTWQHRWQAIAPRLTGIFPAQLHSYRSASCGSQWPSGLASLTKQRVSGLVHLPRLPSMSMRVYWDWPLRYSMRWSYSAIITSISQLHRSSCLFPLWTIVQPGWALDKLDFMSG